MSERRDAHGHALSLLGLGRAGRWEADSDHLVDGCKEAKLGWALEVPREQVAALSQPGGGQDLRGPTAHTQPDRQELSTV